MKNWKMGFEQLYFLHTYTHSMLFTWELAGSLSSTEWRIATSFLLRVRTTCTLISVLLSGAKWMFLQLSNH